MQYTPEESDPSKASQNCKHGWNEDKERPETDAANLGQDDDVAEVPDLDCDPEEGQGDDAEDEEDACEGETNT